MDLTQSDSMPAIPGLPQQSFGDYEVLSEIARGGMGVVYKARQVSLNRVVALKMILAGRFAQDEDVVRFRVEAEAAARLSHQNIVTVFDVGEVAGQHFFSMEFIEGRSLAQRLASGPLPAREAARYVRQLGRAIHYAHCHDIVHRDLKPSNVMIDGGDEPQITDFGLAKQLDTDSGQTRTGTILGTPSYMAPEQAQGKIHEIGPACDVYSLGAILYELVTGRPPFRAATPLETALQVIHNDPVPPTLLNPAIPSDLENICLKCLEKDPLLRYASAAELADDLDRFLNGDSILAGTVNVVDRLTRILGQGRHGAAFSTWSSMIFIMAGVVAVEHVLVYLLIVLDAPHWVLTSSRTTQFILLGILFWYNRGRHLLPTSAAERELWSIWIGYLLAYPAVLIATRILLNSDLFELSADTMRRLRFVLPYPFLAIASGVAFFAMGSNYWGRCYVMGIYFLALGALLPWALDLGPLLFGLSWAGALIMIGRHLQYLDVQAGNEQRDQPTVAVK